MPFESNVFINCPFDLSYLPILKPILFVILDMGLEPRIATESLNSGRPRIDKIIKLINESKYGIHDLSRIQAAKEGEFYRMNMPFELGVDIGCSLFGTDEQKSKQCLVLEAERFRYQAALSDLSNSDIEVHNNEPQEAMAVVRAWLAAQLKLAKRPIGPTALWNRYNNFMADNFDKLINDGYSEKDIAKISVSELIDDMRNWVKVN